MLFVGRIPRHENKRPRRRFCKSSRVEKAKSGIIRCGVWRFRGTAYSRSQCCENSVCMCAETIIGLERLFYSATAVSDTDGDTLVRGVILCANKCRRSSVLQNISCHFGEHI